MIGSLGIPFFTKKFGHKMKLNILNCILYTVPYMVLWLSPSLPYVIMMIMYFIPSIGYGITVNVSMTEVPVIVGKINSS